ncbi:unnamed protein product [Strongylus vulgaris]|uniref:Uncharacterized protein n=1 Tax=Strongylus vulgaris TaxID=40348 RepID=A0A3P7JFF3_STRVU|nr:unnamed protein product [Strongylus vulgaris]
MTGEVEQGGGEGIKGGSGEGGLDNKNNFRNNQWSRKTTQGCFNMGLLDEESKEEKGARVISFKLRKLFSSENSFDGVEMRCAAFEENTRTKAMLLETLPSKSQAALP